MMECLQFHLCLFVGVIQWDLGASNLLFFFNVCMSFLCVMYCNNCFQLLVFHV